MSAIGVERLSVAAGAFKKRHPMRCPRRAYAASICAQAFEKMASIGGQ